MRTSSRSQRGESVYLWEDRQHKRRAALSQQLQQVPRVHLVSSPVRVWVRLARAVVAHLDGE